MTTPNEMLNVRRMKVAAQLASFDFARHLQWCQDCRVFSGRSGSAMNLCAAGLEASDKSIAAALAYADVDQDFARKYAALTEGTP